MCSLLYPVDKEDWNTGSGTEGAVVFTNFGSLLRPLFDFLCSIFLIHGYNILSSHPKFFCRYFRFSFEISTPKYVGEGRPSSPAFAQTLAAPFAKGLIRDITPSISVSLTVGPKRAEKESHTTGYTKWWLFEIIKIIYICLGHKSVNWQWYLIQNCGSFNTL